MSKFLKFNLVSVNADTKRKAYDVLNKKGGYPLGFIEWYSTWRQYCFNPEADTVFSLECLQDICDFIKEIK